MNYKKIFKRETKVIAYVVIALTLVVIGSSYALFMQVKNNTVNQVVTAGSLTITYSSSNNTNGQTALAASEDGTSCLKPMDDGEGKNNGCDFKLSIKNTGTLPMAYDLLIYNNSTGTTNNLVDLSNFKHQLTKQVYKSNVELENGSVKTGTTTPTVETVSDSSKTLDLLESKDSTDKKILEKSVIQPNDTIAFDLKIWIKDDADEEIIGKQVSLKLDVVGVVYEGETLTNTIEKLVGVTSNSNGKVEKFEHSENNIQSIALDNANSEQVEYRYTGLNPDNYVYFGCDTTEKESELAGENVTICSEENLYRIIGVIPTQDKLNGEYIPRTKIIKDTYWKQIDNTLENKVVNSETAKFNYTGSWSDSDVYNALNKSYWESLTEKYQKYIAPSVLYFGNIPNNDYTPEGLYKAERSDSTGVLSNVGLMYPSDYGYSLGSEKTQAITSESDTSSWLKQSKGQEEWLLTSPGENALTLKTDGSIGINNGSHVIRPTVYLQENVYVSGGTGTKHDPYRLLFR